MIVQICVGSSCHLKGSERIVGLFQEYIEKYHLDFDIALVGSFCTGSCNRSGVTIQIDDDIFTGVTPETFDEFFDRNILSKIKQESE